MTHEHTRREALKGAAAVTAAAALAPLAAPAAAAPVPPLPVIEERLPITLICRRPAHFDPVGDPEEVQAAWTTGCNSTPRSMNGAGARTDNRSYEAT